MLWVAAATVRVRVHGRGRAAGGTGHEGAVAVTRGGEEGSVLSVTGVAGVAANEQDKRLDEERWDGLPLLEL